MFKEIATFKPHVVIIDPITSLMDLGTDRPKARAW
jgi:hypothetical protein